MMKAILKSLGSRIWFLAMVLCIGCAQWGERMTAGRSQRPILGTPRVSPTENLVTTPVEVATDYQELFKSYYEIPRRPVQKRPSSIKKQRNEISEIAEANEGDEDLPTLKNDMPESLKISRIEKKVLQERALASGSKIGSKGSYRVRRGDTLMMISFLKYGNVYRWREIYDANRDLISDFNLLIPGTVLQIRGEEYVVISRNGKPYLIRKNDTLMKISQTLYKTRDHWKDLWENNRQLIHDPNKIYSGFTLYYLESEQLKQRQPSSSPR
jgi:nucleoid-associated protein YgaU